MPRFLRLETLNDHIWSHFAEGKASAQFDWGQFARDLTAERYANHSARVNALIDQAFAAIPARNEVAIMTALESIILG